LLERLRLPIYNLSSIPHPRRGALMGLEHRDYYRDGSYTDRVTGWGIELTPVVKYLIVANVIVFLLQIFATRPVTPQIPEDFEAAIERRQEELDRAQREAARGKGTAKDDEKAKIDQENQKKALRKAREDLERMRSQMPGGRVSIVQEWLELDPEKVKQGQVWRLLTCAFCHHRLMIWHILFNMVMLYWFGTRLENMYGSREFLLFYLAAALCGSLAYVGLAWWTGSSTPAIGASGAVMGVMMLYTIFYPFETFMAFWFIPVPLWVLLGVYVLFDLHPVLLALAGDQLFTGVAHAGHLGGLAFGFLYWKLGLRLEAPFDREGQPRRWSKRRPARRAEAPAEPVILSYPERDALAEQVDAVLKKISEQGKDSLTDEERDILIRASTKYRGGK
jgi:membrane associated rhomboid family serine protease